MEVGSDVAGCLIQGWETNGGIGLVNFMLVKISWDIEMVIVASNECSNLDFRKGSWLEVVLGIIDGQGR